MEFGISFDDMETINNLTPESLSQKSFELNNLEKNNLIEIKEEEKNIIIYCIENSYKNDIEQGNIERAEITKNILEKLHAIKNKETKSGTFTKPYFF